MAMKEVRKESLPKDVESVLEKFDTTEMDNGIWVTSSLAKFKLMKRIKTPGGGTCSLGTFVGGEAYRGILSGLSDAFVISEDNYNHLIQKDCNSAEILRPFLQGKGLVAYGEATSTSHLLYIPKGFTLDGMGIVIDEEDLKKQKKKKKDVIPSEDEAWKWFQRHYPAVSEWLIQFKEDAIKRSDKGDYWWELRACDYYDKFAESKIFYQTFQTKPCFVFDNSSTSCNNSMWFLSVPNKSLLALLCSKMGWWLISELCPPIQNGYQLIWDNFRQIPIPMTLPDSLSEFATQAEQATSEGDMEKLQIVKKNIDKEVYRLYQLTYDDVLIIDPAPSFTREEYENEMN